MKKYVLKTLLGILLVCILAMGFLFIKNDIGISSSKLEADVRSSQKIMDEWMVDGTVSDTMAAFISSIVGSYSPAYITIVNDNIIPISNPDEIASVEYSNYNLTSDIYIGYISNIVKDDVVRIKGSYHVRMVILGIK